MKMIVKVGLPLLVMVGCAGGSMSVSKPDPKMAACKTACKKAMEEAMEKCAEEVDKETCEAAAKKANEKCVKECKDS